MVKREATIKAVNGLHVRPASTFVKKAKEYTSDITIEADGKSVSGKSLFRLQTLELSSGKKLMVCAQGDDEEKAVTELVELIESFKE
ncbi:HPr family phosphocarrier protein [Borrelia hermsii]|uniref:Phosphocarrier protein HPr n=3 Tax=Borrelia hermsii TaxID=140 RepID=A0AAN0X564_BORHE|nr:HPr family phosphocarrier protein [Borrelia hermsii]AAX17063.1 phosphocarrier protein HPr [Borrelia hermsii DAH]AJW73353.1 phosphocarrier protein HPr [Borrelia hermsii CC1]AMR75293.1 Phosphocarrier protein HPr [Borrelia hermsii]ANA43361.1 phosphocarrier protein HPr [Borrelia hermsii HS1]UCP01567.1 HPr family phosphocarrier protein [Borrelia hermsii]